MKILAINGSPRKNGNTSILLRKVLAPLEEQGFATELVQLGGVPILGCSACGSCKRNKNMRCVFDDDPINGIVQKMIDAEAILVGSPVYFSNVTAEVKAFIDRAGYVCRANGFALRHKIGAAVTAVRRAGSLHTFNSINQFFLINQMVVPGSTYWNLGVGRDIGDVEGDEEGLKNMANLAENIAWLLKKLHS